MLTEIIMSNDEDASFICWLRFYRKRLKGRCLKLISHFPLFTFSYIFIYLFVYFFISPYLSRLYLANFSYTILLFLASANILCRALFCHFFLGQYLCENPDRRFQSWRQLTHILLNLPPSEVCINLAIARLEFFFF